MAARRTKIRHDEETRAKIQAAQLVNRLQDCVNGKIELSAVQVSAAKALLDKVLPNLQSTELSGGVEQRQYVITDQPVDEDKWERDYSDSLGATGGPSESTH